MREWWCGSGDEVVCEADMTVDLISCCYDHSFIHWLSFLCRDSCAIIPTPYLPHLILPLHSMHYLSLPFSSVCLSFPSATNDELMTFFFVREIRTVHLKELVNGISAEN